MTTRSETAVGDDLGRPETGVFIPPTARRSDRRRRPTGAAPPLPRHIGRSGIGWLLAVVVLVVWMIVTLLSPQARRFTDQVDAAVSRSIVRLRVEWLSELLRGVDRAATGWTMFFIGMTLVGSMMVFRRWRHLFTLLASVTVVAIVGVALIELYSRPRPYDVTIIGRWQGYSLPSATVAIVSYTTVGVIYAVVVPGRSRTIAKIVGGGVIALVAFARLYLGVDHPFDVLTGIAIGVTVPLLAFRFFTPNEFFPVTYRRGKTAHLDVGGRRGEAIRRAVEDQLGVTVLESKPVGLAGSGGSTPLRLRIAGEPDTYLFGKLYAMNHVRADRWYKLGRTILYGRLEDERPFQSVRRLVQHEDYAMRVLSDAGIPTAQPVGIVELTPEREYMLVTEFFDGSVEIGDADVDDQIIDEGLQLIRQLWDAGIAHRDIKPANLMVQDGHLHLIDVAFVQVRPSPWREAVDLANMMLVLAVRTDAQRVYQHTLRYFTPDEIAEAFAAARGIASPTQLRMVMKEDGRNLVDEFRTLAPDRRPISLQRWGPRRVFLVLAVLLGVLLAGFVLYESFVPAELPISDEPTCGTNELMILMAQSVPTAPAVPCVQSMPAGWHASQVTVRSNRGRFDLQTDDHHVEVMLRPPGACSEVAGEEVPSDELDMRRFVQPTQLTPQVRVTTTYLSPGACVTYDFALADGADPSLVVELESALAFQPRSALVTEVDDRSGLSLCGVGAPPCTGGRP